MQMTDTDHLSTPADMVAFLKRLTKVMRDVEAIPDAAQQRFWEDTASILQNEDPQLVSLPGGGSLRSATVLYNILASMCGPQLTEMVNGVAKEYYESLIAQMRDMTHDWDMFLEQLFDKTKGTDREDSLYATVALRHASLSGALKHVPGSSNILAMTGVPPNGKTCFFLKKDILALEITATPTQIT
jgi:hypothetical protein